MERDAGEDQEKNIMNCLRDGTSNELMENKNKHDSNSYGTAHDDDYPTQCHDLHHLPRCYITYIQCLCLDIFVPRARLTNHVRDCASPRPSCSPLRPASQVAAKLVH